MPDELLYGRSGYLYSLRYVLHHLTATQTEQCQQQDKLSSTSTSSSTDMKDKSKAVNEKDSKQQQQQQGLSSSQQQAVKQAIHRMFDLLITRGQQYVQDHYNTSKPGCPPLMYAWHG